MTDHTLVDRPAQSPALSWRRVPGVAVVLLLMVGAFAAISPGFTTAPNITNVLLQSIILLDDRAADDAHHHDRGHRPLDGRDADAC